MYTTITTIDDLSTDITDNIGYDISEIIGAAMSCLPSKPNIIYGILNKNKEFIKLPITIKE